MSYAALNGLAVMLIVLGVLLVLGTAAIAYNAYKQGVGGIAVGTFEETLTETAATLLDVLVRIAFLGIMLAAGSILISRGIEMLRVPREGAKE